MCAAVVQAGAKGARYCRACFAAWDKVGGDVFGEWWADDPQCTAQVPNVEVRRTVTGSVATTTELLECIRRVEHPGGHAWVRPGDHAPLHVELD